jgi:plasmid replication initiation protein
MIFYVVIAMRSNLVVVMSDLVVKDNRLIQASYVLGVAEQRMMLLAIVGARETGLGIDSTTLLTVRAEDYARHFGVTRQAAYMALQDAVETLFNRRATVDVYDSRKDRMRLMTVRWVTAMDYNESEASVTLRFGHEVVPLVTRLEEQFTSYELQQIAGLTSSYAIRLYEMLMMWKVAGKTPIFEINQFRIQLGLDSNVYQRVEAFKRRVLDLAITQINEHTDIIASYEQHKTGRNITGISFSFKAKKSSKQKKQLERDMNTVDLFSGLTDKQITLFAQKLARLPELSQEAPIGGSYEDFAEIIQGHLKDPSHQKRYKPYLTKLGLI